MPTDSGVGRRNWWGLGLGLGVVVLAVGLAAVFLRPTGIIPAATPTAAKPTLSAWDESETPRPTGTPSPGGTPNGCDDRAATQSVTAEVRSGRLQVGQLSTAVPAGWSGPRAETRVPYGRDGHGYVKVIDTETRMGWESSMTLGVTTFAEDVDLASIVTTMTNCVLSSSFYTGVKVKLTEFALTPTTISGHEAVQADSLLSFSHPLLNTKGSRMRIIAVRTSQATQFFFSVVPEENAEHRALVEKMIKSLTVS